VYGERERERERRGGRGRGEREKENHIVTNLICKKDGNLGSHSTESSASLRISALIHLWPVRPVVVVDPPPPLSKKRKKISLETEGKSHRRKNSNAKLCPPRGKDRLLS